MAEIIDTAAMEWTHGTGYPEPYRQAVAGRASRRLAEAAGLEQFGANLVKLAPGAWSSQRHWHSAEDELVYMLEGEATLITEAGERPLRPGSAVGFKAGVADGHHLVNRSERDAIFLVVGSKREAEDAVDYPDIDLAIPRGTRAYHHKDGRPYT
jgi:uncharacterized cupin superfamily protein